MEKSKTVIKKYSDRRLYDSGASRYVKLEDIARMIRSGAEVEVVDARTGKDLTRVVLTEIVMEDARERETGLPMHFLRQLVMASDRATHEFLSWYLNGTLDIYRKAQETLHTRFSEAKQAVSSPLEFVRTVLAGQPLPGGGDGGELEQLRRRVAELEARLAEAGAARPKRPARKRRTSKSGRAS
jgi:polyhydroxyalkanoate synthesis repressor PhaR